jgi:ABC-type antimicrobial peptide transport system permease subunit
MRSVSLYVPMVTASLLTWSARSPPAAGGGGLQRHQLRGQRTQEFGVRMALGASPGDLVRMVARESLLLAVPGVLVGMALALAAARGIGGMLVGVSAADPATFAGAALVLLVVTLFASYWPARRAARVDPMSAVRSE